MIRSGVNIAADYSMQQIGMPFSPTPFFERGSWDRTSRRCPLRAPRNDFGRRRVAPTSPREQPYIALNDVVSRDNALCEYIKVSARSINIDTGSKPSHSAIPDEAWTAIRIGAREC